MSLTWGTVLCMAIYRTQVVLAHESLTGNGTNTWHARILLPDDTTAIPFATSLQALYNAIGDNFPVGTDASHDGVWTQVDDEGVQLQTTPWTAGTIGGDDPLPPQCAMVLAWRTAIPGRRRRGRTFVGPLGVGTLQDNGTPTEAARADLAAAGGTFIASFSGLDGGAFGVWSANSSEGGPEFFDFTGVSVANRFASLRSRRD